MSILDVSGSVSIGVLGELCFIELPHPPLAGFTGAFGC
jgi:hypothetical protein